MIPAVILLCHSVQHVLATARSLLYVSFEFLATAPGPMVSMESRLHQRSHDASHGRFIPTSVPLSVMLHS